jgi:hypothetical protein
MCVCVCVVCVCVCVCVYVCINLDNEGNEHDTLNCDDEGKVPTEERLSCNISVADGCHGNHRVVKSVEKLGELAD